MLLSEYRLECRSKTCGVCKQILPFDKFHKRSASLDGLCSKCKDCQSEYIKEYRQKNGDSLKEKKRIYAKENIKKQRERWYNWYQKNREHWNAKSAAWWKDHSERKNVHTRQRYVTKLNASGHHTSEDIKAIKLKHNYRCNYCGTDDSKGHIDHIIPLTKGGTNYGANLQLLCVSCNTSKGNKMPWEYFGWA